ncbi:hypothetical protein GCM10009647_084860 [Streptomyces sanglieri]
MPIAIKFKCSECGQMVKSVFDDGTLYPSSLRGCPGQGCIAIHEIYVMEFTKNEIEQFGWNHLDLDW